jgi:hypothetical protein
MKRSSVVSSAALVLPQLNEMQTRLFIDQKTTKQVMEITSAYLTPTEEMIRDLNRIGQEYPFCVYYKEKTNDPL